MMTNFKNVSFYFIAPDVVKMGKDIKDELDEKGVKWEESEDLLGVASEVDVLYQTRIQKERFGDRLDEYEACRGIYNIDTAVMDALRKDASSCIRCPGWMRSPRRWTPIRGRRTFGRRGTGCTSAWRCSRFCSRFKSKSLDSWDERREEVYQQFS